MIKIISRKSDLAVIQAELVSEALKKTDRNISISFVKKETEGDIDQLTSLSKLSNIGVFTNDIRESLLNNEADIAVHSLKDLPIDDQNDTSIVSILERADSRDILFLKKDNLDNYNNKELKILTSSPRRVYNFSNFLKSLLPFNPSKITFEDIRGNIPTRLKKLLNGNCQGLIVAKAAIDRLISCENKSISNEISTLIENFFWMVIPLSLNPCAPGQGAIAIEVNSKREDIIKLIKKINHNETYSQVAEERGILQNYGGGCHQKIGVSIEDKFFGKILTIKGQTEEGLEIERREIIDNKNNWKNIPENNFFPSNIEEYKLFERKIINKNLIKINKLKELNSNSLENYLIISDKKKKDVEEQIILNKLPIDIKKLIESINIKFLKKKYSQQSEINLGIYKLNLNSRSMHKNGTSLNLTEREANILIFLNNSKKPVNISKLQTEVWGHNSKLETHTVETHIYRLRKKIKNIFNDKSFIKSSKSGYIIK